MEPICKTIGYGLVTASHLSRLRVQRLTNVNFTVNNVLQANLQNHTRHYSSIRSSSFASRFNPLTGDSGNIKLIKRFKTDAQPSAHSFAEILEREIEDEQAELGQQLSTDQFPGFSVETDHAEVKLTRKVGSETLTVRFNVSSSLNEWPTEGQEPNVNGPSGNENNPSQQQTEDDFKTELLSMPDFQVQISKGKSTLEFSCYFEQADSDEEMGQTYLQDPIFNVDEIVLYESEPKQTEFAVNAEYFHEDLQTSLLAYLAERGIDDRFAKNLVQFATSYEKKQYIGLMQRLKNFVS